VEASAVDDIVAETFAIAWRRLPARADPLPWLYGVARRVVHGHRRAHVRRAALTARLVSRHAATPPPDPAELIVDDPALAVAFATLTEREREAVRLVAWEGLSTRALPRPPAARPARSPSASHRPRRRRCAA
jgi:DNA-directed RNA polymerase specialized sigma24 family protein